jgi:hypothetical protein
VIDTVVSRYCDHQPLYRQSAMLERDSGVELGRASLDGGVLKAGELLVPMASAMRQELCYLPECVQPVGTWDNQLYNQRVVYNLKRHGTFLLGNRMVTFERRFNVQDNSFPSVCWLILLMSG